MWLDVARILVRTTRWGIINEFLRINVMGAVFGLWVVEEGVAPKINLKAALVGPGWEEASSASSHGGDMFRDDKVFSEDEGDKSP